MNRFARSLLRPVQTGIQASKKNFSTVMTKQTMRGTTMVAKSTFQPYLMRNFSVEINKLESLGDSITSAVLLSWSKNAGDAVKEDDVIAIVETDKVTMEIRAKTSGIFTEALVKAGQEIQVGADLYKLDTAGTAAPVTTEAPKAAPAPEAPKVEAPKAETPAPSAERVSVPVPAMGDSITQGVLSKWVANAGQAVALDEVIAMIETDKVTVEVRSPHAGTVVEVLAAEGSEVIVGNPLFVIIPGAGPSAAPKVAAPTPAPAAAPAPVKAAAPTPAPAAAPAKKETKPAAKTEAAPTPVGDRSETRVKMTRMRQRIAQRLKESQNTAAMLTTFQEVDMTNIINLRNKYKDQFEKVHGVKLGFMSAFVKASSAALREVPAINAVIDDATNEIVFRNYCDISVAVASPTGLVVPVLRNTEKMSFADVEKSIGHYSQKAKEGSLALEDMTGGTFTISNGGVFGSLFGTPIINPPQSAILGMHATKLRPMVVMDGKTPKVEARPMMYLALTYDHRLIDGREAVTFLKSVANKIEDPSSLLLEL